MNAMTEIVPGSRVRLHLSLAFTDGTEALSTFGEEPLECELGDGTLMPGMELALYGLRAGDTQTLTLGPEQAYGPHDDQLVQELPRNDFPAGLEPEPGQVIGFSTPGGEEAPGTILAVEEDRVQVDFNHPLAGHEVVFRVEILEVSAPRFPVEAEDDCGCQ